MTITARAVNVMARLKVRAEISSEWVGPGIRIRGRTYTVAQAEAWMDGYEAAYEEVASEDLDASLSRSVTGGDG